MAERSHNYSRNALACERLVRMTIKLYGVRSVHHLTWTCVKWSTHFTTINLGTWSRTMEIDDDLVSSSEEASLVFGEEFGTKLSYFVP